MAGDWNFADVWETVAQTVPENIAQVHGAHAPGARSARREGRDDRRAEERVQRRRRGPRRAPAARAAS